MQLVPFTTSVAVRDEAVGRARATVADRALLPRRRAVPTTDESSRDRSPDGDSRGLLAAWRWPERVFALVSARSSQCPAYKPTRHHHHADMRKGV